MAVASLEISTASLILASNWLATRTGLICRERDEASFVASPSIIGSARTTPAARRPIGRARVLFARSHPSLFAVLRDRRDGSVSASLPWGYRSHPSVAPASLYSFARDNAASSTPFDAPSQREEPPYPMPVQFPTSMASPTDSVSSKDPVKPDTSRPAADATSRVPSNPYKTNSTPEEGVETSSHSNKAETHSNSDNTFASSPTLVCADPLDQLKETVGPVEQDSTADSSRRSSAGSLRFDIPQRPGLPRGNSRTINGHRIRNASPPPNK